MSKSNGGSKPKSKTVNKGVEKVKEVTIRFAGDSGDGIQLTGERFTTTSAMMGDAVATMTDFPAEIRAPAGSPGGVSGFQLTFSSGEVYSSTDRVDALVVMNPAAMKMNISYLRPDGMLIVNRDAFTEENFAKAGYSANPLETEAYSSYNVVDLPISALTAKALDGMGFTSAEVERCKNFFALGLMFWLYQREIDSTRLWINKKFKKNPKLAEANCRALDAGWDVGETTELFATRFDLERTNSVKTPGTYRHITGNKAAALGLVVAAQKSGLKLYLASYPITPATEILQELSGLKHFGVVTYQAEDEIAAIGATVGAAFGGALAATSTSGPGMALKSEFLNLAVITELPMVIINVQRGGPSTGLPTKTEQADLLQALWGRNGESPMIVMAARSPKDCFDTVFEASRIAVKYMHPVIVLSDSYLSTGSEVWRVPEVEKLKSIPVKQNMDDMTQFKPYLRDPVTLARPWVIPGTPAGTHRIGGLEKEHISGAVSTDSVNHEKMVLLRAEKVNRVVADIPPIEIFGDSAADTLIVAWGSSYGLIRRAVDNLIAKNKKVAYVHLRFIHPLPQDLKEIVSRYKRVIVPENNTGQLWIKLMAEMGRNDIEKYNKVQGSPFRVQDIEDAVAGKLGSANQKINLAGLV